MTPTWAPLTRGELAALSHRQPADPSGYYLCLRCEVSAVRLVGGPCWCCEQTDALVRP